MPSRHVDFPVFDADNHMYETPDALTRHLPREFDSVIQYVQIGRRTKIAVKGRISEYIPNPTFAVVARPGAQEEHFKFGNPDRKSTRQTMGDPIPVEPAFQEPEARLKRMNELGVDRALLFPTLGTLIEERLRDDQLATHAVIHAFNQWLHDQWSFAFENRIFAAPIIALPLLEKGIAELEWALERGARVIIMRPAPVPCVGGPRSFALKEFDPFWKLVEEAGVIVALHASDSGYQRWFNEWEGIPGDEFSPFKEKTGFAAIMGEHRPVIDSLASAIGHGLCSRFPRLKLAPIENGGFWVGPLLEDMARAYRIKPQAFEEDPIEAFRRTVFIQPFHEDDPVALVKLIGPDNVIFGSDYPHPEGMADPITYIDDLQSLSGDVVAKVMGGNMDRLMEAVG
jgi:predicted TIM-barrel fold metal-dependent hydrolase